MLQNPKILNDDPKMTAERWFRSHHYDFVKTCSSCDHYNYLTCTCDSPSLINACGGSHTVRSGEFCCDAYNSRDMDNDPLDILMFNGIMRNIKNKYEQLIKYVLTDFKWANDNCNKRDEDFRNSHIVMILTLDPDGFEKLMFRPFVVPRSASFNPKFDGLRPYNEVEFKIFTEANRDNTETVRCMNLARKFYETGIIDGYHEIPVEHPEIETNYRRFIKN